MANVADAALRARDAEQRRSMSSRMKVDFFSDQRAHRREELADRRAGTPSTPPAMACDTVSPIFQVGESGARLRATSNMFWRGLRRTCCRRRGQACVAAGHSSGSEGGTCVETEISASHGEGRRGRPTEQPLDGGVAIPSSIDATASTTTLRRRRWSSRPRSRRRTPHPIPSALNPISPTRLDRGACSTKTGRHLSPTLRPRHRHPRATATAATAA